MLKVYWFGYGEHAILVEKKRDMIENKLGMKLITIHNRENADIPWKLETVYKELKKADIIIIPNNYRTQPCKSNNKLTQAMALGKPIICEPMPAYVSIVQNKKNAIILNSDSEEEWFNALKLLKEDEKLRKTLSMNALETAKKYNLDDFSKQWIEALVSLEDSYKAEKYCELGNIFNFSKDWDNAIQAYQMAANQEYETYLIQNKYSTWFPNLQLCAIFNSLGKVKEAALANERALRQSPENPIVIKNRKLFKDFLKDSYPKIPKEELKKKDIKEAVAKFNKKIGWCVPNIPDAGTIRIRALNVCKKLKEIGYDSEIYSPKKDYDFIIMGKKFYEGDLKLIKYFKSNGKKVVCDLSEDLLNFAWVTEIITEANLVICCSTELTKKVLKINNNALTIEDSTEQGIYG